MRLLVELHKKDGKDIIAKNFAEEFEKFENEFMINARGGKEFYKFVDLIEKGYEYLVVYIDNEEILNQPIKKEL
jgi:hypothetical protein